MTTRSISISKVYGNFKSFFQNLTIGYEKYEPVIIIHDHPTSFFHKRSQDSVGVTANSSRTVLYPGTSLSLSSSTVNSYRKPLVAIMANFAAHCPAMFNFLLSRIINSVVSLSKVSQGAIHDSNAMSLSLTVRRGNLSWLTE